MPKIIRNEIEYSSTTSTANQINYLNTASGLSATNVQGAVDELAVQSGIYTVIGTQTAATNAWTGNLSGVPALYDGLTIMYYLPYNGNGSSVTLTLTLDDGTVTDAVSCYYTGTSALTTAYSAGTNIIMTYWSAGHISIAGTPTTTARWVVSADYNYNSDSKVYQYATSAPSSSAYYGVLCGYNSGHSSETNYVKKYNTLRYDPYNCTLDVYSNLSDAQKRGRVKINNAVSVFAPSYTGDNDTPQVVVTGERTTSGATKNWGAIYVRNETTDVIWLNGFSGYISASSGIGVRDPNDANKMIVAMESSGEIRCRQGSIRNSSGTQTIGLDGSTGDISCAGVNGIYWSTSKDTYSNTSVTFTTSDTISSGHFIWIIGDANQQPIFSILAIHTTIRTGNIKNLGYAISVGVSNSSLTVTAPAWSSIRLVSDLRWV